jgi:hypothetical protein
MFSIAFCLKNKMKTQSSQFHDLHSLPNTRYSGDQIKKIVMDWACFTFGVVERTLQGFGGKSEGEGINGKRWLFRVIILWILGIYVGKT